MSWILTVFVVVYLGMAIGRLPGFKLDRTGIALLGAIALVATGDVSFKDAWGFIDVETMGLLFGLMLLSSQLHLAGIYAALSRRLERLKVGPVLFLGILVGLSGFLGALLTNDVICLAMAPILIDVCRERRLNPTPYLLALACSTNAASTGTIMGSPQNMLIGESLNLSFRTFLLDVGPSVLLSVLVIWGSIALLYRGRWASTRKTTGEDTPKRPLQRYETIKGVIVVLAVVALFLFSDWPRSLVALGAGGILLTNRHFRSRDLLDNVDWQLLVLFMGLFVVNGALQQTHMPDVWILSLQHAGIDLHSPGWLFLITALMSDLVSNVPAVMLLLPYASQPMSGPAMALASGLSSNLILIGSMANIIVVDAAARRGIRISFWEHMRTGIPVTLLSLLIAAAWLWLKMTILAP